jgi:PAS domain S-box-containing protein
MRRSSGPIRILHVEDEPGFAHLTATLLESENERFDVTTATDVADGLECLREAEFDCIVSDYDLPRENGLTFLESVRAEYPDVPFILYTGRGSEEIASEAISAGVTDYIQKESGSDQYTVLANRISNTVEQFEAKRRTELSRRAMDTTNEGLSLVEPDGVFSYVNPAFADLFEYEPEALVGEHWTVLYHNEAAERLENDIIPAVIEHGYWSGETVRLTRSGERLVTDHRLSHTAEGVIVCTAQDITPERTTPGGQPLGFELLADALEGHAFYTLDHEGYITRWNTGAQRLTGYSAPEVIGEHVGTFFTEADRERGLPSEMVETAKAEGEATDAGRRIRKDGSRVKTVDTVSASYDAAGTIRGFVVMVRDASRDPITEELERKTSYLDAVMEYTTRPLFMKDTSGEYLLANRACEMLFDLPEGGVVGRTDYDLHPEPVADEVWANDRRVLETEEVVEVEERVVVDGEERVFLSSKGPVYLDEASNGPDAVFGMTTDITERTEHQRELEETNAHLEELATIVNHEFQNP